MYWMQKGLHGIAHAKLPEGRGIALVQPTSAILGIAGVIIICAAFMAGMVFLILLWQRWMGERFGREVPKPPEKPLTPTQKFILAASSVSIGCQNKCVIDIWGTRASKESMEEAARVFEWGWGEFTRENAMEMAEFCLNDGHNVKYREFLSADTSSPEFCEKYTAFQRGLFTEMKQAYPRQGMLAWDLVRVFSVVGGAYMGGCMDYEEAAKISLEACRRLQKNFSSWDDMVGSYTYGYWFWRGKKSKDRMHYYKSLKRTWIYEIPWNTELKESEL